MHHVPDSGWARWVLSVTFDKHAEFAKSIPRVGITSRRITQCKESVVDEKGHERSPTTVIKK